MKQAEPDAINKEDQIPLLIEPYILGVVICLLSLGLVMVYSTTGMIELDDSDSFYYLKRQVAAVLIGIVLAVYAFRLPVEKLRKYSWVGYLIGVLLLSSVLIPGLGVTGGGAKRWLNLGIVKFQPGELVKLMMVVMMARYFSRHEEKMHRFSFGVVKPLLILAPVAPLYLLQRDFGSFAVLLLITMCMMMISGVRVIHFALCGLISILLIMPMVILEPYRVARLVAYMNPFKDVAGSGYQLIQSLIALGSGELVGQGIGRSQQKLHYLPAAHTDFIFAVIGEELGFIGCCLVLLAFLFLLVRIVKLTYRLAEDLFLCCLALGIGSLIVIPAFLNVGIATGLLPTKGMVLPLISYGGSNIIVSLLAVGLILNLFKVAQLKSLGARGLLKIK